MGQGTPASPTQTVTETPHTDWGKVLLVAGLVLAGLLLLFLVASALLFPGSSATVEGFGRLGIWLVVVGVGLMVVALFIALLDIVIKAFTSTIKVTATVPPAGTALTGAETPTTASAGLDIVKAAIAAAAELVKVPAGVGAFVGILGVAVIISALAFGTPMSTKTEETVHTVKSDPARFPTDDMVTTTTTVTTPAQ